VLYYSYLTMSPPTSNNWTNLALLRLNAFGVGINGFYLAIDTVVLPVLVLILAPEALKNTYLAALGLSGLLVAGVIQVIVGRLSDRTRSPLGRRVPYLLGGSVLICLGMVKNNACARRVLPRQCCQPGPTVINWVFYFITVSR